MPKKLAVAVMAVLAALAIVLPVGSANAGTVTTGPSWCTVTLHYWEVSGTITPTYPFVSVTMWGDLGADVKCPLPPPLPPIQDIIAWG